MVAGTLTLDDAAPLRNGQYRWSDLPYGTYTLKLTGLPAGNTTSFVLRALGVEGTSVSGFAISLDQASGPELNLRIYLISGVQTDCLEPVPSDDSMLR